MNRKLISSILLLIAYFVILRSTEYFMGQTWLSLIVGLILFLSVGTIMHYLYEDKKVK